MIQVNFRLRNKKLNPGYIYILQNPSFPDLLKIGKTTRTPTERAKEVSRGTGIPTKFNVVFDIFTPDCDISEKEVHKRLKEYRVATDREFFKLPIDVAKESVIEVVTKHRENEITLLERTREEKVLQFKSELENEFLQFKNELKNEIVEKRKHLEKIRPVTQKDRDFDWGIVTATGSQDNSLYQEINSDEIDGINEFGAELTEHGINWTKQHKSIPQTPLKKDTKKPTEIPTVVQSYDNEEIKKSINEPKDEEEHNDVEKWWWWFLWFYILPVILGIVFMIFDELYWHNFF